MSARILDVKYHLLLPDVSMVGSPLDYYQWAALLKSLSGFEAYRRQYHAGLRPVDIAEFVVFEGNFPRSLRFSVEHMRHALEEIGLDGAERTAATVAALEGHLQETSADRVLSRGLHEYLEEFLVRIDDFNTAVSREYFEHYLGEER
jgi:uncharacterized alpha-E superfamily protein